VRGEKVAEPLFSFKVAGVGETDTEDPDVVGNLSGQV
jgi:hypothetical protein